ncbi:hypothetical protein KEM56_001473, partial [Ascosphaera pollenicola]
MAKLDHVIRRRCDTDQPCTHCQNDDGPFVSCKVLPEFGYGACANCQWLGNGSRCSMHCDNMGKISIHLSSFKSKTNLCSIRKREEFAQKDVHPPTRERLNVFNLAELKDWVAETKHVYEFCQAHYDFHKVIKEQKTIVFSDEE